MFQIMWFLPFVPKFTGGHVSYLDGMCVEVTATLMLEFYSNHFILELQDVGGYYRHVKRCSGGSISLFVVVCCCDEILICTVVVLKKSTEF